MDLTAAVHLEEQVVVVDGIESLETTISTLFTKEESSKEVSKIFFARSKGIHQRCKISSLSTHPAYAQCCPFDPSV
jgi:hypothetical protein